METSRDTDQVISQLVAAAGSLNAREAYLYRQSLLSLVRLAKAEQMREVRDSVTRLIGEGGHRVLAGGLDAPAYRTEFNPLN
jgi:DNA-binding FrmR family transcriptional regulator